MIGIQDDSAVAKIGLTVFNLVVTCNDSHMVAWESYPKKAEGAFRLLHTADWHLGKTLAGLPREDEHLRWLEFLLNAVRELDADALLIAGDVFDSANPPQSAQERYYTFLSRVYHETRCAVVVVAGNHDSPAQLEAPRRILKTLRVAVVGGLPSSPAELLVPLPSAESPALIVAAVPFLRDRDVRTGQPGQTATEIRAEILNGIRQRYSEICEAARQSYPSLPLVATGHLTVAGARVTESERDIHIGGLGAVSEDVFDEHYSYVALGHLHAAQQVGSRGTVRYSGSPFPLSFSEATDEKELRLLDFQDGTLTVNCSVGLPVFRHLIQLTSSRADLTRRITEFSPPTAELETWVEVIVTDPVPGENLFEIVQEAARNRPWKVVRVLEKGVRRPARMDSPESETVSSGLLENPMEVFNIRLEQEQGLTDSERESLRVAFLELLNRHREMKREEETLQQQDPVS